MRSSKILILIAIGVFCTNARVIKKKISQRTAAPKCRCPLPFLEQTYGSFGTCNCQNIYLDQVSNCGCKYIETYGVVNAELPNCNRVSAIRLPKRTVLPIASCDTVMPVGSYEVLPAINLPELFEVIPGISELPCSCQEPMAFQFVDNCGCRIQRPVIELPSPVVCGCQNMPCGCQNIPCGCQNIPCGCQNMPCSCQTVTCGCKSLPCACQTMPCGCQNYNCKCQNIIGSQLPVLESPCACQTCQLSPVELPVYAYGCQSLPPPVIGCGGKYLRQVTIPPPFL